MADFFFTAPIYSLRINRASDVVAPVVFFAVAAILSTLVDRLARRGVQVIRAQAEAEALARLAGRSLVSGAEALPNLVAEIRRTFELDGVAVVVPADKGCHTLAAVGEPVAARPDDAPLVAELDDNALLVVAGKALSAENTGLMAAFAAQLRQAQERMRLERDAASGTELAEANSLRGAILAAVSHDLRTPLASIKAAATSLLSDEVEWDAEEGKAFAKTIDAQADRLTHLVANLLDMSRLQAGAVMPAMRSVGIEDVPHSAVGALGPVASGS